MYSSVYTYLLLIAACRTACGSVPGWGEQQDTDQFHIQTDGDDERYFLYQTHNGQYRKERRLKDGSVVGTTGWVGADGYLRLQDYIADDQGYRIYKSKTVYVGQDRPIAESLKIAKSAPTDPGYGLTAAPAPTPAYRTRPPSPAPTVPPPASSLAPPHAFPAEVSVTPPSRRPSDYTPSVDISPNSIDSSTEPRFDFRPTVAPVTADELSSPHAPQPPSPHYEPQDTNSIDDDAASQAASTPYRRLDYFNPNSYRHSDEWRRRAAASQARQGSAYSRPRDEYATQYGTGVTPRVGDGYTPQFSQYDGSAFTRGGFRYYLPKQYHEEVSDGAEATGSFGYVDPFGIRRVIYYNASPDSGFVVRKNNRYVGHDATPYDPRPVD